MTLHTKTLRSIEVWYMLGDAGFLSSTICTQRAAKRRVPGASGVGGFKPPVSSSPQARSRGDGLGYIPSIYILYLYYVPYTKSCMLCTIYYVLRVMSYIPKTLLKGD